MTIDEAIKEFTDWAKDNRNEQSFWAAERDENDETNPFSYADCEGLARDAETRAEYNEQLAAWLRDLRQAKAIILDMSYTLEVLCDKVNADIGCSKCPYSDGGCRVKSWLTRQRAFCKAELIGGEE